MNFKSWVAILLGLVITGAVNAHGASKSELAKCSVKANKVKRLECFDALAQKSGASSPSEETAKSKGNWRLRKEKSPLDDSTNIYLTLNSDNIIRNQYGRTLRPVLSIRCKENTTALSIWWGVYLGLDSTNVTHRIGKTKAKTTEWTLSTKNEHIGKWRGGTSIPFIKKLFNQSELLLQVTPYGENSVMATFNITGLNTAIEPVREQCNW